MRLKLKRKEEADIVEEETDVKDTTDAGKTDSEMHADLQQESDKNRAIVEDNTQDIAGNVQDAEEPTTHVLTREQEEELDSFRAGMVSPNSICSKRRGGAYMQIGEVSKKLVPEVQKREIEALLITEMRNSGATFDQSDDAKSWQTAEMLGGWRRTHVSIECH